MACQALKQSPLEQQVAQLAKEAAHGLAHQYCAQVVSVQLHEKEFLRLNFVGSKTTQYDARLQRGRMVSGGHHPSQLAW